MTTGYRQPGTNQRHNRSGAVTIPNRGAKQQDAFIDLAEAALAEAYELPGAGLDVEGLDIEILAQQADEFTCSSCFLVRHRSQLARENGPLPYCRDCEG